MVNLTTTEEYSIRVTGETDAKGNSVPLPTLAFGFKVSDDTLGIFTVDADGLGGTFVAKKAGSGNITITDPVLTTLTAQSDFTIAAASAAAIQFTESAPVAAP